MVPKHYSDPLGAELPALEKNILKYRAMEMLLVLFYAEELKRDVLDRIQATDRLAISLSTGKQERVPRGVKNPVDRALNALVADGAVTRRQKEEIVRLIDYRNVVAHQMHNILADVSPDRIAREYTYYLPEIPKYDYTAVKRLQYYRGLFDDLYRTHHYATTLTYDQILFGAAEKTFLGEMKRLRRVISRQIAKRSSYVRRLKDEMSLSGTGLKGGNDPRHPLMCYDDKRLTKRGTEVCFRLFDCGKSPMAVAHLMGLSLRATRKRRREWANLGGKRRPSVNIDELPKRKFYFRRDR